MSNVKGGEGGYVLRITFYVSPPTLVTSKGELGYETQQTSGSSDRRIPMER
jgi:hypothetical protein